MATERSIISEELKLVFEEYKKDLKEYVSIRDPIVRDYVLNRIFDKYQDTLGYNPSRIKAHAAIISKPTEENEEERKVYYLGDLLSLSHTLPQWLVPNLIGSGGGLYLCSAQPKVGKTLIFGYQLLYSVAVSGEFLGLPCQKGKVLFFQCEEPLPTVIKRIRTKGMYENFEGVQKAIDDKTIRIERDFRIDADLTYLKEVVQEFQPALVIYDSLSKISAHVDTSENDASFASLVYTLQAVHNNLGVPGLLIHHNNKNKLGSQLDKVAGSARISAATDGILMLEKEEPSDGHQVQLSTIPREGTPLRYVIERKKDSNGFWSYQTVEVKGVSPEILTWEKRIIREFVSNVGRKYTASELAEALRTEAAGTFTIALERLAESYQIGEDFTPQGTRVYWLSENSPWLNIQNTSIAKEIEDAQKLLNCKTKEEVLELNSKWLTQGEDYKNKIWSLLHEDERDKIYNLVAPRKFQKNEWVRLIDTQEAHKVISATFFSDEKMWVYSVEGSEKTFFESELEIHPEYVDYSKQF